uniref:Uncharacterized protein n=1 Tax=Anopheles coluzzii TaxID=1518534 RepID=A0A8W7P175_ANOCL
MPNEEDRNRDRTEQAQHDIMLRCDGAAARGQHHGAPSTDRPPPRRNLHFYRANDSAKSDAQGSPGTVDEIGTPAGTIGRVKSIKTTDDRARYNLQSENPQIVRFFLEFVPRARDD